MDLCASTVDQTAAPTSLQDERDCHEQVIMIVDDVAVNAKLLRAHLQSAGYVHLRVHTDATEVLAAIYREPPDLVLLDLMMPVVSGLDILTALRSDACMKHLPIVILTGTESTELKKRALTIGATDFLTKPVDIDELLPRVRNTLLIQTTLAKPFWLWTISS